MDDSLFILSRDLIRYRRHSRNEHRSTPPGRSVRRQHARTCGTGGTGGTVPLKVWAAVWRTRDENVNAWCERKGFKGKTVAA